MKRALTFALLLAPFGAACGSLIGAEWDGTLRPEGDASPVDAPTGDTISVPDGGDGDADGALPSCDACSLTTATAIAAGEDHTCAIVEDGVLCWGYGILGQLGTGDGQLVRSARPLRVADIPKATAVVAGYAHTCAIVQGGGVKCWGWNAYGQLGGGSKEPDTVATPVTVQGLPGPASAIAASWGHSCAVVAGALYCWGNNQYGQLGTGSSSPTLVPTQVTGLTAGVTAVSGAIKHTCAIVSGAAKCWGTSALGNGTTNASPTPVDVTGIASGATSIGAGAAVSCAVVGGAVSCWGISNEGVLGDGPKTFALNPNPVPTLGSGTTVVGVSDHACALVAGSVRCWGPYPGNGTETSNVAVSVSGAGGANASALAVGQQHACTIVSGAVWCWGSNSGDQLGVSAAAAPSGEALSPVRVGN